MMASGHSCLDKFYARMRTHSYHWFKQLGIIDNVNSLDLYNVYSLAHSRPLASSLGERRCAGLQPVVTALNSTAKEEYRYCMQLDCNAAAQRRSPRNEGSGRVVCNLTLTRNG
jgi:hypothetical protein